jgi:hypothetical protein
LPNLGRFTVIHRFSYSYLSLCFNSTSHTAKIFFPCIFNQSCTTHAFPCYPSGHRMSHLLPCATDCLTLEAVSYATSQIVLSDLSEVVTMLPLSQTVSSTTLNFISCLIFAPTAQAVSSAILYCHRLSHLLSYIVTDCLICNPTSQTVSPACILRPRLFHLPSSFRGCDMLTVSLVNYNLKIAKKTGQNIQFPTVQYTRTSVTLRLSISDIFCDKIKSSRIQICTSVYSQHAYPCI